MKAAKLQKSQIVETDFDKVGKYNQNNINGFDGGIIEAFLDLLDPSSCSTVLDAMSGDGNLTNDMLKYCQKKNIKAPSVVNWELSSKQCGFAKEKFVGKDVKVVCGDILQMKNLETGEIMGDNQFDVVMLKSGNHELPLAMHAQLYKSLFRVLKPGGKLVNLGIVFDNAEERAELRQILKIKDTLAGLHDAAKNRHFLVRNEFYPTLRDAGFVDVSCGRSTPYIVRTSIIADAYFQERQYEKKVEYEQALMAATHLRRRFQVLTMGDDSLITFPGEITIAKKPKLTLVR